MKINVRLLLITFIVIVIISLSSTFIYHSVTTKLLIKQHSNTLLNSLSDFKFTFQSEVSSFDNELINLLESKATTTNKSNLDFVFQLTDTRKIISGSFIHSNRINKSLITNQFDDFLKQYPNIIIKFYENNNGESYYYGKIITEEFLNNLSEKIRAEIVLVVNKVPYEFSHTNINNLFYSPIIKVLSNNATKKIYYNAFENLDFFATRYKPNFVLTAGDGFEFVLFTTPHDFAEFRNTMQTIAITIALAGIFLALVFILLFTTKIRKQISLLSDAAKITASGDLSHRVPILSKDELGNLGIAFNSMLDNIKLKEETERQYSELITIINETPMLKDLCDSVLEKITSSTNVSFGVFYIVENSNAKPISTYGISQSILKIQEKTNVYSTVIEKQKWEELIFENNSPTIKTGLVEIKIKYLLVMPLVFNRKVIGVIELACEHVPEKTPVNYLTQIAEQLAVGLNSALSYEKLENLVNELRVLNEDYQKQNLQISEQNAELIELQKELRKQTEELEEQRKKAVELTHVKSQFLANMSHELRTPLNSIIGLTELISDDILTHPKTKDRLKIVFRNGNKLLAMINNILEFSKIESGKFDIENSNFILSEFFLDIYNAMEPLVAEKDLEFEIHFESEYDFLINTDRHKLEQVLLNLLSNAIKFTEVGKIIIDIAVVNNLSLKISVIDSGIGIADDDKKIIFEEFQQSDLTRTKKYQGAGLGLAICKKYVELLGGSIDVLSNKTKGTTFFVLLNNVILEKFVANKDSSIFNVNKQKSVSTKEIIIWGNDNQRLIKYFENKSYIVKSITNIIDLVDEDLQKEYDGIIVKIENEDEKIWEDIYKLKSKFLTPIKIFSSNKNGAFVLNNFDLILDVEVALRLKKIIKYASIITQNISSIFYIGASENIFRNEVKNIDEKTQFTSIKNFNTITDKIEEQPDLIIVDAVIDDSSMLEDVEKFCAKYSIPIFVHLTKLMVEKKSLVINNSFQLLVAQQLLAEEEVIEKIEDQFSLIKNVKKSVTSSVENVLLGNTELTSTEVITNDISKGTFNVLAVDDDKDTLFTVGEILQNIGCEVTFANNGAECLAALEKEKPDLVLLDIMMPIMDGFETIKKIRTNSDTKELIVYAITAQAMLDDLSIIKNNGFDDLITKPVIASTLSFKIQKAIQKRASKL